MNKCDHTAYHFHLFVLNYFDVYSFTIRLMHSRSRMMNEVIIRRNDLYYYGLVVYVIFQSCYAAHFQNISLLEGLLKPCQVSIFKTLFMCVVSSNFQVIDACSIFTLSNL
jgi:hypothetical protein